MAPMQPDSQFSQLTTAPHDEVFALMGRAATPRRPDVRPRISSHRGLPTVH
ncbi:aspartate aminotransferase [Coccidioides immitis RMSCC 3703]|uniref:Aspartate aminotransferase n=1 Tax=Coccidioides immitis RMSCC 3703 TaxID=454286 RepID=A0A0J8QNC9_COCIT|nr:aspartate aminotransferase [Coccidioides immitis RMSCC 3703]